MQEFLVGQILDGEHQGEHEVAVGDHDHGFRIGFAAQRGQDVVHTVLGHIGNRLACRRTPVQRIGVLEVPVARVVVFEFVLGDGVDLAPRTFAQHTVLLPFGLGQGHGGCGFAGAHVWRDHVAVEQLLLADQPAADAVGLLASGGGESPGAVGYGDVVLRVQGIVALLARLDDDVRFGFAMPDYV